MQEEFKKKLEEVLSEEKLAAYRNRRAESTDEEIFAHFIWNIQLGEALYPSLQALEVALRNRLCLAIKEKFKGDLVDVAESFLQSRDLQKVDDVKSDLKRKRKPIEQGLVIESLNFGFWTTLFDVRYERTQTLWPGLIKTTIPFASKYCRTRAEMSKRLNKIRKLRNRIFHHGSIWHWSDLNDQHQLIIETLKWLSPELQKLVISIDRFPEVYHNGYEVCLTHLQDLN